MFNHEHDILRIRTCRHDVEVSFQCKHDSKLKFMLNTAF